MIRFTLSILVLVAVSTVGIADEISRDVVPTTVWFDSDADQLVPVDVEPQIDDSINRNSRWLPDAQPVRKAVSQSPATSGMPFEWGALTRVLGWGLMLALVVLVVVGVVYSMQHSNADFFAVGSPTLSGEAEMDDLMMDRVKELSPELQRTGVIPRDEAKRLMDEGRYDDAMVLLFGHQLLLLDRGGFLRLSRGKTNGRYVREAHRNEATLGDLLRRSVDAFERSYFGRHRLSASDFEQLWNDNDLLEAAVRQHSEVAA